jgi:hypothetical protein
MSLRGDKVRHMVGITVILVAALGPLPARRNG